MADNTSRDKELELHLANFKLDVLQELIHALPGTKDPRQTLDFIMNRIFSLVEMEGASILLLDEDKKRLVFHTVRGEKEDELTGTFMFADKGIAGKVIATGRPALVDDTNKNEDFYDSIDDTLGYETKSLIAVPIKAGKKMYGVLEGVNLDVSEIGAPHELTELFESFADLIAVTIEHGETIEKLDSDVKYSKSLLNVSHAVNSALDLQDVLSTIMNSAKNMLDADASSLLLADREKDELFFYVAHGEKKDMLKKKTIPLDRGIVGTVATTGKPLIVNDAYEDSRFDSSFDQLTGYMTKSILCVPMYKADKLIGVLEVINKNDDGEFDETDLELLQTIANEAAVAVKSSLLQEEKDSLFHGALRALAGTVSVKDEYEKGHSERVAFYAEQIGKCLRPDDWRFHESLRVAGMIHDVGKVGIPDTILLKSGAISDAERIIIETHSQMSHEIASSIGPIKESLLGILHHHERYDGEGYPHKLKGEDIPLSARILAIADAFDAMTTDRPYRPRMERDVAVGNIKKGSGAQFDPELVETFLFANEAGLLDPDDIIDTGDNI